MGHIFEVNELVTRTHHRNRVCFMLVLNIILCTIFHDTSRCHGVLSGCCVSCKVRAVNIVAVPNMLCIIFTLQFFNSQELSEDCACVLICVIN